MYKNVDHFPPAKVVIVTTMVSVRFRLCKLSVYTELNRCVSLVCHFVGIKMGCESSPAIFFAGPQVVGDLFLEIIRAFYSYCRDALGSDLQLSYTQSGNSLIRYGFDLQLHTLLLNAMTFFSVHHEL